MSPRPTALRREGDDVLVVEWDDRVVTRLRWSDIRKDCPCAACREEREKPADPFRVLKPNELAPLRPLRIEPIGHYAYRIVWSDGHDSGLFTLAHLRALGAVSP